MSQNQNHRVIKHGLNDNKEGPPDRPPTGGSTGGAAARAPLVERVDAIAPHANDNNRPAGTMQWTIVRHFAELFTLGIAVYQNFKDCASFADAFKVICDADDLKRLGIITAITIATSGLAGMVRGIAHGCCLPAALRAARRALGALVRAVRAWPRPH